MTTSAEPTPGVAGFLRTFRNRAGLTQEALAEVSGLSPRAITALEGGRRHPRPATVDLLISALELSGQDRRLFEQAALRRPVTDLGAKRQLPPPIADFTGRTGRLNELVELLRSPYAATPGVVIAVIGGMGGVGKTTLAIQASHLVAEQYPDGALFLNLRGGSGEPVRPADAITQLMRSLGVPVTGDSEDLAASRFRTALAGRRVLIVLDDAASAAQVIPLIPGTAGSAVVITSRKRLNALPGVRHLDLTPFAEEDALALLGEVAGRQQVAAAPEAAAAVVRGCGSLPLAIRIAAGQAAGGLPALAERLVDDAGRLNALTEGGTGVRASISLSIDGLAGSDRSADVLAAKAFPLLALLGGDHFSLRVAAKVLDRSLDDTEDLLEQLIDVHLLETPALHRYRMHDLVRDVGRESTNASERTEVRRRELRCYLAMVWRCHQLRARPALFGDLAWAVGAEDVLSEETALEWLDGEVANMVRLIRAARSGDAEERLIAARTALGMLRIGVARLRFAEVHEALLAAVELVVPDGVLAGGLLIQLAQVSEALGQYERAVSCLQQALPIVRRHGDVDQLGTCLIELGYSLGHTGRAAEGMPLVEEALELIAAGARMVPETGARIALGVLAGMTGDLTGQRAAFDRAQERMDHHGPTNADPIYHCMMGNSFRDSGQYEAALQVLTQALEESRELGADLIEIDAHQALATLYQKQSKYSQAVNALTTALTIAKRHPTENREPALQKLLEDIEGSGAEG